MIIWFLVQVVVAALLFFFELAFLLVIHPFLVDANECGLACLIVLYLSKTVVDVVLKFLSLSSLRHDLHLKLFLFFLKPVHLQLKILHNQFKVRLHSAEMLHFLVHLCCLLLEGTRFFTAGPDILLELLNLVVQHKLELLQFLCPLNQTLDSGSLVVNRGLSLTQFRLLALDSLLVSFNRFGLLYQFIGQAVNGRLELCLFSFKLAMVVVDECELALLLHAIVDSLGQNLLLFFLDLVDVVPDLRFDLLTILLVLSDKLLDL